MKNVWAKKQNVRGGLGGLVHGKKEVFPMKNSKERSMHTPEGGKKGGSERAKKAKDELSLKGKKKD